MLKGNIDGVDHVIRSTCSPSHLRTCISNKAPDLRCGCMRFVDADLVSIGGPPDEGHSVSLPSGT
jgi:hypothetical protein